MRPRRPKIGVQIIGTRWMRFIIANDRGEVWNGLFWSERRGDALLYAHIELIRRDVNDLKRRLRNAGWE